MAAAVARHDVKTVLNYFKENEDGSPPHPTYVDRPETYDRPFEPHQITVKDIAGEEDRYSLDKNGFQIYTHVASEKAFTDDDKIKAGYYAETERLLRDAYVPLLFPLAPVFFFCLSNPRCIRQTTMPISHVTDHLCLHR